ncbi:DUF3301 domain-containing protein [Aliidiomarina indica]|uniref:DUF3301 domain-containing protein n=1 Tax=Aliidiomarina indica TaxID=2749147 RepID=UPI0018903CE2|nr:DUF3301 domain-containing protein [Aliidiomarina indica]
MNINLMELVALLALLLFGYLFWQWRLQEEFARKHAEMLCKRHDIQFLDIARSSGRPRFSPKPGWEARFVFGFSSDTQSRYEGEIMLLNRHLRDYSLPTYRTATEPQASDLAASPASHSSAQSATPEKTKPAQQIRVSYGVPAPTPEHVKTHQRVEPSEEIVDAVFKQDQTTPIQPFVNGANNTEDGLG